MSSPTFEARPNPWLVTLGMLSASFFPRSLNAYQLETVAIDRPVSVHWLNHVAPEIENLSSKIGLTEEQTQLTQAIYASLEPPAQTLFMKLAQREIRPGEYVLLNQDHLGQSLLEGLAELIAAPWYASFEKDRKTIIENFFVELAWPGQLNQANHATCGTGLAYPLYLEWPAEAVRIMTALLSEKGETTVRNGALLKRARYVTDADRSDKQRSISEKLIQSALMELANGTNIDYCNHCDEHFHPVTGVIYGSGLRETEIAYLYEAIFGKKSIIYLKDQQVGNQVKRGSIETLLDIIKSQQPGFVPIGMHWASGMGGEKLERKHIAEQVKGQTIYNEPHHVLTGGPNRRYGPDGYHFVLVTEIREGRVYFRNLHGPSNYQPGTELQNPPRKVEDPQIGLESMTLTEFSRRLRWTLDLRKK